MVSTHFYASSEILDKPRALLHVTIRPESLQTGLNEQEVDVLFFSQEVGIAAMELARNPTSSCVPLEFSTNVSFVLL